MYCVLEQSELLMLNTDWWITWSTHLSHNNCVDQSIQVLLYFSFVLTFWLILGGQSTGTWQIIYTEIVILVSNWLLTLPKDVNYVHCQVNDTVAFIYIYIYMGMYIFIYTHHYVSTLFPGNIFQYAYWPYSFSPKQQNCWPPETGRVASYKSVTFTFDLIWAVFALSVPP